MLTRKIGFQPVGALLVQFFVPMPALTDGVLFFSGTGQLGAPHVRMLVEQGERVAVGHLATSSFERLAGIGFHTYS